MICSTARQYNNTKITPNTEPQSEQTQTERGQSSHDTNATRTRLLNTVYFLINFFRHLPKNLKKGMSAILFTIPKEIQTAPTPLMLEH